MSYTFSFSVCQQEQEPELRVGGLGEWQMMPLIMYACRSLLSTCCITPPP